MDSTLNSTELTRAAIDALKNAYNESTNTQARQSISKAYTAVSLLKFVFGNCTECEEDIDYDPSDYCAAI